MFSVSVSVGDCFGSAEVVGHGDVLQRGQRAASDSFCCFDDPLHSFSICSRATFILH